MGGHGSTRWGEHGRRWTVEECRYLSATRLARNIVLEGEDAPLRKWTWRRSGPYGADLAVACRTGRVGPTRAAANLSYDLPGSGPVNQASIILDATKPNYSGLRWWFLCPTCRRRTSKLYLPPKSWYFACRACHRLTYQSCQESHKWDLIAREYAEVLGGPVDVMIGIIRKWVAHSPMMAAGIEIARPGNVRRMSRLMDMPVPAILIPRKG